MAFCEKSEPVGFFIWYNEWSDRPDATLASVLGGGKSPDGTFFLFPRASVMMIRLSVVSTRWLKTVCPATGPVVIFSTRVISLSHVQQASEEGWTLFRTCEIRVRVADFCSFFRWFFFLYIFSALALLLLSFWFFFLSFPLCMHRHIQALLPCPTRSISSSVQSLSHLLTLDTLYTTNYR